MRTPEVLGMRQYSPIFTGITAGVLAAGAFSAVLGYAVRGRSSQMFGRSVYRGSGARRSLALTFDDGPSEGTPELLHYLATEGVRATFFQCGANVRRHPAIARLVREEGHEIGNHTYSHARLSPRLGRQINWRSPSFIEDEIARTQRVIEEETGVMPRLFRAPYGFRWYGVNAAQERHGLLGVMWTVIGHDWEWLAAEVAGHVLHRVKPGGIVCLHDGRDTQHRPDIRETIESVKKIVPVLKGEGYMFETVSELLQRDSVRIERVDAEV